MATASLAQAIRGGRELQLPSDSSEMVRLVDEVLATARKLAWCGAECFSLEMALVEGVTNAIKHGNGGDPLKLIRVAYAFTDEGVHVEVADEGAGFDLGDVPDPTQRAMRERSSGRGIHLMRALMTTVEYSAGGSCLRMFKRIGPSESSKATLS